MKCRDRSWQETIETTRSREYRSEDFGKRQVRKEERSSMARTRRRTSTDVGVVGALGTSLEVMKESVRQERGRKVPKRDQDEKEFLRCSRYRFDRYSLDYTNMVQLVRELDSILR